MSLHNYVVAELQCLRRGNDAEMEIETFFGPIELERYRIGDTVSWLPRKSDRNGGRPDKGDFDGEGYMVCPACGLDSFVKIHIRADVLTGVSPDPAKRPYINVEAKNGA